MEFLPIVLQFEQRKWSKIEYIPSVNHLRIQPTTTGVGQKLGEVALFCLIQNNILHEAE